MKLLVLGHKGWIGQKYVEICKIQSIEYITTDIRANDDSIHQFILDNKVTHVLSCIGRTHGKLGDKYYPTIDYLQHPETLSENINDNLYAPLNLALFCHNHNIHFTYMGTGCIFTYTNSKQVFNDDDIPNFYGSNYSIVKGFTDRLMHQLNVLNLRIRMPITSDMHPRNFITKITSYEYICSISNSMSVLGELIPLSIEMMKNKEYGTYNFTNPGIISHNEILEMYQEIVDPNFTWKNFGIEEQSKVLLASRSNNELDVSKLLGKYKVTPIKTAVHKCLCEIAKNTNLNMLKKY